MESRNKSLQPVLASSPAKPRMLLRVRRRVRLPVASIWPHDLRASGLRNGDLETIALDARRKARGMPLHGHDRRSDREADREYRSHATVESVNVHGDDSSMPGRRTWLIPINLRVERSPSNKVSARVRESPQLAVRQHPPLIPSRRALIWVKTPPREHYQVKSFAPVRGRESL